jgi:hypothetical protein
MGQTECPCSTGWQVENINLISKIGMGIGFINLVIPLNKTLYAIPLVSTVFSTLMIIVTGTYLIALSRYSRALTTGECSNNKKCKLDDAYEPFVNVMSSTNITTLVGITIIVSILSIIL